MILALNGEMVSASNNEASKVKFDSTDTITKGDTIQEHLENFENYAQIKNKLKIGEENNLSGNFNVAVGTGNYVKPIAYSLAFGLMNKIYSNISRAIGRGNFCLGSDQTLFGGGSTKVGEIEITSIQGKIATVSNTDLFDSIEIESNCYIQLKEGENAYSKTISLILSKNKDNSTLELYDDITIEEPTVFIVRKNANVAYDTYTFMNGGCNYSNTKYGYNTILGTGNISNNTTTGGIAITLGMKNKNNGYNCVTIGYGNEIGNDCTQSVLMGIGNKTTAKYTCAIGAYNSSIGQYQSVFGKYNREDSDKAFIVGNGSNDSNRNNAFTIDWQGNTVAIGTSTATAHTTSSSKRYKDNIKPMTDEEAKKILDVDVVSFDYKEELGMGERDTYNRMGVIAEDTEKIIPTAVIQKEIDGEMVADSVDYSRFVPYLIKMVQDQQKEIEELKAKLGNI